MSLASARRLPPGPRPATRDCAGQRGIFGSRVPQPRREQRTFLLRLDLEYSACSRLANTNPLFFEGFLLVRVMRCDSDRCGLASRTGPGRRSILTAKTCSRVRSRTLSAELCWRASFPIKNERQVHFIGASISLRPVLWGIGFFSTHLFFLCGYAQ